MSLPVVVVKGVLLWTLTLGGLRAVIVQPEHCGEPTVDRLTAAAELAVDWFADNQHDDGSWLYRYDRSDRRDVGGYNLVRHAGVTMSLEQAASAGIEGAADVADGGLGWALDHLVEGPGFRALGEEGAPIRLGASGLLVAALVERRDRTGSDEHDELLHDLAAFLTSMVTDRGQVLGVWDPATAAPVPESWNQFFTGEVMWALAMLHRTFPDAGYDATAVRIADYLVAERDANEGWWPDVPDHWAAYGLATMTTWPDGPPFTAAYIDYARRQMGFQSMQIRWESQRTNSFVSHYTRGRQTLGAGLGTIGEALTQWTIVAAAVPELDAHHDDVRTRALCTAGVIIDRQAVSTDDPAEHGAWFQFDVTQMDDQQHALSALLFALPLAADRAAGEAEGGAEA